MTFKEIVNQLDIWEKWRLHYNEFVPKFIEQAITGKDWKDWNQNVFYEFFERGNGHCVSSLKQGYFTRIEKEQIKENWDKLAPLLKQIAENQTKPDFVLYQHVKDFIRKYTSQNRKAATNRLIASLQPELLCSIVNEQMLYSLFEYLKDNINGNIPQFEDDWFKNSYNIWQFYRQQLSDKDYSEIITLPWETLVFFREKNHLSQNKNNDMSENRDFDGIVNILKHKKQLILQGAPGTGKTYKTAELAVAICNPDFQGFGKRDAIMEEYNRLKMEEQICFTTFHQSMDYEEFVEGLKPVSNSQSVAFEPKAGLFKDICEKALLNTIPLSKDISTELEFDDIYDDLIENMSSRINYQLPTKTNIKIEFKPNANKNLNFKYNSSESKWSRNIVSKKRLRKLYMHFDTPTKVDGIQDINNDIRSVIKGCDTSAYWAVLKYIVDHRNTTEEEGVDIENLSDKDKEAAIQVYINTPRKDRGDNNSSKNYVLIIDEINRGNISKILGELITLLEADKRIGEINELTAKLPYSQKEFGVPPNLYIIGTMNMADRSVGYIDYAIRRRFAFVSIPADIYAIIAFYKEDEYLREIAVKLFESVRDIIRNINSEFDIDDLMIGHSYFMANSIEELDMKLSCEIKPLLREYVNDGIINLSKNDKGKYECIEQLSINTEQTVHE